MRRSGFTWIEAVVVLAIIGILAAILMPVFSPVSNHEGRRGVCRLNLKTLALGFRQYLQDYDNKFPPVAVAKSGYWAGSLQPYVQDWRVFQCPTAPGKQTKTTDYFYNSRLACTPERQMFSPKRTILVGDGTDDSPPNYALSQLPAAWLSNARSPAKRHLDGANYAFVDDHVKWVKPEKISMQLPKNGEFTFASR